jgi:Tol biopolymer transport system component
VSPASATFPGRNGLIAYTGSAAPGSTDIFTVDPESGAVARLTTTGHDSEPSWSPDGTRIAFASRRDGADSEIYVMDADGSHQTRLTFNPANDDQPAWSPDGRIVFSSNRTGNSQLLVMNADGTHVQQLTSGAADYFSPDWSPDGRSIVFTTNQLSISDTWVMKVADRSIGLLVDDPDGTYDPKWSPDGTKVSYSYGVQFRPSVFSWVGFGVAGTGGELKGEQGAFSPDGTTFTYTLSGAIYVEGSATPLATGSDPDWGVLPEQVTCEVPRLRGRTLAAARTLLHRDHCSLGRVRRMHSRRVRRGRIMAQSPHAGAVRRTDAKVAVIVSRGPRRLPGA